MCSMTRQHFQFIADVLSSLEPPEGSEPARIRQWRETVNRFAHELPQTNGDFKPYRFRQAAGLKEE